MVARTKGDIEGRAFQSIQDLQTRQWRGVGKDSPVNNLLESVGETVPNKVKQEAVLFTGLADRAVVTAFFAQNAIETKQKKILLDCRNCKDLENSAELLKSQVLGIMTQKRPFLPNEIIIVARSADEDGLKALMLDMVDELNILAGAKKYSLEIGLTSVAKKGGLTSSTMVNFHCKLVATDNEKAFSTMTVAELETAINTDKRADMSHQFFDLTGALENYTNNPGDKDAKNGLIIAINEYMLANLKDTQKTEVARQLLQQVINAEKQRRELNAVNSIRLNPGHALGFGSKGLISSMILPNGMEAAIKWDSPQTKIGPWSDAGIEMSNPEQSKRGVATFLVNQRLATNCIPDTVFVEQTDLEGRSQIGQAIQVVRGTPGQKFVRVRQLGEGEYEENAKTDDLVEVVRDGINGPILAVFEHVPRMVPVNYADPIIQKGLSTLQFLDNIIGAADRHPGNMMFEMDGANNIIRVVGIDNDDNFGKSWIPTNGFQNSSKTPGFPPLIDLDTAIGILSISEDSFARELSLLPTSDAVVAIDRFRNAQAVVRAMVQENKVATVPGWVSSTKLSRLKTLSGAKRPIMPKVWGTQEVTDLHVVKNSYLGGILKEIEIEGPYLGNFLPPPIVAPVNQLPVPPQLLPLRPLPPTPDDSFEDDDQILLQQLPDDPSDDDLPLLPQTPDDPTQDDDEEQVAVVHAPVVFQRPNRPLPIPPQKGPDEF